MTSEIPMSQPVKAPVLALWICMILAWILFVLPIPFTIILAIPLNLAAFILAIICLVRRRVFQGIVGLLGTTVVALVLYVIGFGVMAFVGIAQGEAQAKVEAEKAEAEVLAARNDLVLSVAAVDMATEYNRDAEQAAALYNGKIVEVRGKVKSVGKNIFSLPQITFEVGENAFRGVNCDFTEMHRQEVEQIRVGSELTVRGKVEPLIINITLQGSVVEK